MTYYNGDTVQWAAAVATVGPFREVAIATGERRKVVGVGDGGRLWLEGKNGRGLYGTVDPANVRLVRRGEVAKLLG